MAYWKIAALILSTVLLTSQSIAMPTVSIVKTDSPLFEHLKDMQDIYYTSCVYGKSEDTYQSMPMFENDVLTNRLRLKYPKLDNYTFHSLVYAGFELGRVLYLTDLSGEYMEQTCQTHALNFAGTVVNAAATTNGVGANNSSPSIPQGTDSTFPNPFNDWLRKENDHSVKITPRVASQSACSYMYHVLDMKPIITVGALDITLEMMEGLVYNDYSFKDVSFAYPYLLEGAKFGRMLYASKQNVELCYD